MAICSLFTSNQSFSPLLNVPTSKLCSRKQVLIIQECLLVYEHALCIGFCPRGIVLTCLFQFCIRASTANSDDHHQEGKLAIRKEKDEWKIDFSGEKPTTPLLDTINYPVHMKNLSIQVMKIR